MAVTVDADLFPSLDAAIQFVAERGGGTVYTSVAGTLFAKSLKLPPNVTLTPPRPLEDRTMNIRLLIGASLLLLTAGSVDARDLDPSAGNNGSTGRGAGNTGGAAGEIGSHGGRGMSVPSRRPVGDIGREAGMVRDGPRSWGWQTYPDSGNSGSSRDPATAPGGHDYHSENR